MSKVIPTLKTGGWMLFSIAIGILLLILFFLFVNILVPFYAHHLQNLFDDINSGIFLFSLIFLILCAFKNCRSWAGTALALSAIFQFVDLWLGSLVNTYSVFGAMGVFIGIVVLGIGIFITGLVALVYVHAWLTFIGFLLSGIYIYSISSLGNKISNHSKEKALDEEALRLADEYKERLSKKQQTLDSFKSEVFEERLINHLENIGQIKSDSV